MAGRQWPGFYRRRGRNAAVVRVGRAVSIYLAAKDPHLQGRTLIRMGETIGYVNPDRGIAHIEHGLQLIDPVREPRLELPAQHGLAVFLCAAGRAPEALAILDRARANSAGRPRCPAWRCG